MLPVGIGLISWLVFCELVRGSEVGSYFASWCLKCGYQERRYSAVQEKRRDERDSVAPEL